MRISRRLAGAFAIATLLLGLSADAAHLVLEQHEWCVAHATIEHVADGASHSDAQARSTQRGERSESIERDSAPTDEHAACRLVTLTREHEAVLASAECVLAPHAGLALAFDAPRAAPTRAMARYRLAPKNSPPIL